MPHDSHIKQISDIIQVIIKEDIIVLDYILFIDS